MPLLPLRVSLKDNLALSGQITLEKLSLTVQKHPTALALSPPTTIKLLVPAQTLFPIGNGLSAFGSPSLPLTSLL